MKKIISLISAIAMFAAISGAAMAADKAPTVYVNDREIFFDDQEPVILGEGFTVIPARGVFEAMGATVTWKEAERQVDVESKDHNTLVRLTIDSDEMSVFDLSGLFATLLSGQDFNAPETKVTLDVPAQIMNDRTMIPLRAIGEALDAEVEWNGEARAIDITTKDTAEVPEGAPELSLSASADTVAEGETVDVFVNLKNIPADTFVSGLTATMMYDKENFEFVGSSLLNNDTAIEGGITVENPDFADSDVKVVLLTVGEESAAKADGAIAKLTFKSINGKEGYFVLSNGIHTEVGYNTSLLLDSAQEDTKSKDYDGDNLAIDTTPVFVNYTAE